MTLTEKIKLLPTAEQKELIDFTLTEYIHTVNNIVDEMIDYDQHFRFSSKMIKADIPSCLKNQAAGDAASIDKKMFKHCMKKPVLKKPHAVWNNQSYKINNDSISFPVFAGKTKQIKVKALLPENFEKLLQFVNSGTMRISKKNNNYYAQIAYEPVIETTINDSGIMGIDMGIKCPAVAVTDSGKVKFFGNGRENKAIKRRYAAKRHRLQKAKKLDALKKMQNKEERRKTDIDHKISRQIIDFACENGISVIKLENLHGIRKKCFSQKYSTSKSRKNNNMLSSWSFYRLTEFIKYKAELAGIKVIFVNPEFTSQICPKCGKKNKSNDRSYVCECGYHGHRDIVGARNILAA